MGVVRARSGACKRNREQEGIKISSKYGNTNSNNNTKIKEGVKWRVTHKQIVDYAAEKKLNYF
jgi:hypothetical protein